MALPWPKKQLDFTRLCKTCVRTLLLGRYMYITKRKRAPLEEVQFLPSGGVTNAFSYVFRQQFFLFFILKPYEKESL